VRSLQQVRAFTKKTGHKPDFSDPVVLSADRGGITVDHLCARLHATLAKQFHYALVWGTSAKHYPQRYSDFLTAGNFAPCAHDCSPFMLIGD